MAKYSFEFKKQVVDGERLLPMSDDVYMCLQRMIKKRRKTKIEPVVDGKKGF